MAHAQFETIHPFPDGNGRVGRALLHSMLRNKGLTRNVTLPISAGLLADTDSYFGALDSYRAGDPTAMVRKLSEASFAAVAHGRRLVTELRDIRAGWNTRISARRDSAIWHVADLLMRHPVINARLLKSELGMSGNNAYRHINPLVKAEILTEFTIQRRNRAWRTNEILAALDAFAARAGRRRLPHEDRRPSTTPPSGHHPQGDQSRSVPPRGYDAEDGPGGFILRDGTEGSRDR